VGRRVLFFTIFLLLPPPSGSQFYEVFRDGSRNKIPNKPSSCYARDVFSREIGPVPDKVYHSVAVKRLNAKPQVRSHSATPMFLTLLAAVRQNATMEAFLATLETCT
jgi:hypothetical protein